MPHYMIGNLFRGIDYNLCQNIIDETCVIKRITELVRMIQTFILNLTRRK